MFILSERNTLLSGFILILSSAFPAASSAETLETLGSHEISRQFEKTRPTWPLSAMRGLPNVWSDQVHPRHPQYQAEKIRLAALSYNSEAYRREFQKRYGLYWISGGDDNNGLPFSLTKTIANFNKDFLADDPLGGEPGLTINCRSCHTGVFFGSEVRGQRYIEGITNVFWDFNRLNRDLSIAADIPYTDLFKWNPERNSMVNAADYAGRLLTYIRDPYPTFDILTGFQIYYSTFRLPRHRHLERDIPAYLKTQYWINKSTKENAQSNIGLYVDGGFYGNPSSIMYGMAYTLEESGSDFIEADKRFLRYGNPYITSVRGPRYPYPERIDQAAADRGFQVFTNTCSGCHGVYELRDDGPKLVSYPGKIIPADVVGTDPYRAQSPRFGDPIGRGSWLRPGELVVTQGYVPPPLHSLWARAPYLHNASVANLWQLLNPKKRYRAFAIQPEPERESNYDHVNVGWKTEDLSSIYNDRNKMALYELTDPYARIYNPNAFPTGLSNKGHEFGSDLSDTEKRDLIMFLKTL